MRRSGKPKPLFLIAVRTRSRASRTAPPGSPTMRKVGQALRGDVNLHFDQSSLKPDEGRGVDGGQHAASLRTRRHANRHTRDARVTVWARMRRKSTIPSDT